MNNMTKNMKLQLAAAVAVVVVGFLTYCEPAESQVTDTVDITVTGTLTEVVIVDTEAVWNIGDTIQFLAYSVDEDGDTLTNVVYTWASSSPLVMTIDPTSGVAVARAKGSVRISVLAEQISGFVLGWFRPDDGPGSIFLSEFVALPEADTFAYTFAVGEDIEVDGDYPQLCLFVHSDAGVVTQSEGTWPDSPCPESFEAAPAPPAFAALFSGNFRLRSHGDVQRLAMRLGAG